MTKDDIAEAPSWPTAESTRLRPGESDLRWADRTFFPTFPGIHVCGADHEENRFFTIMDTPMLETEAMAERDARIAELEGAHHKLALFYASGGSEVAWEEVDAIVAAALLKGEPKP